MKAPRIHRCLMVYPNGAREEIPRLTSQIPVWLKSNQTFHPSAALFVDGQCRYQGHLLVDEINQIEGEFQ